MNATATHNAAPAVRPGYDPDAATTARRVLPMLADEQVVWLSTVRPDGTPHLVPTWFLWDGEALLVWSKPNAVKVRNLRANPRLMVAVGDPHADFNVGLIEATAELADTMAPAIPDGFFAKYGSELAATGLDVAAFRTTYTQLVRIVPTRFVAWHGRGPATATAAFDRDGRATAPVVQHVRVAATVPVALDDRHPATPPVASPETSRVAVTVAGWLDRLADRLRGLGTTGPAPRPLGA